MTLVLWFNEVGNKDVGQVGGKNASLGELMRHLTASGVRVPKGFALTSKAYWEVLKHSQVVDKLKGLLNGLDIGDLQALKKAGAEARRLVANCSFPPELEKEVRAAYRQLCTEYGEKEVAVAVRSSATAEDLPDASFAGQQESFLNVQGEESLLTHCRRCFASLFTDRAIVYRHEHGFDHFQVALSVGVQKMVRSDIGASGVIFTVDPETGFRDVVYLTAAYGYGEAVVQGLVAGDEFLVFKPTLKEGYEALIERRLGEKEIKIVATGTVSTSQEERHRFCLSDGEVLELARWAVAVEEHYSQAAGKWTPMDMEWAKDGQSGELFLVQARPETVQSRRNPHVLEEYHLESSGKLIVEGRAVGARIGQGLARVIRDVKGIGEFRSGEVLVTEVTDPDWVPVMRQAAAIVTDKGGKTSHAAIVSRELGLPCVVGTGNATEAIAQGQEITVSCVGGERGCVYEGLLPFKRELHHLEELPRPKTRIMMNVGDPVGAFELASLPQDGVGLAREEFIISEYIKIHPLALLHFEEVQGEEARRQIEELTRGYEDKRLYFVDKLAMGIGLIAAAFYPNDVILRFSDFKTNEYANLIGGKGFEPKEANPMLGWRGASRYYHPGYEKGFAMECEAVKRVREKWGLKNLKVMIPMCRTVEEGAQVLKTMEKWGLKRGQEGLEVYVMCEIPINALLAETFCEHFDGMSIGSNDLTQLTLGIDRDNERLGDLFDERNEAVKILVRQAISACHKKGRKIGICGDAPSSYPEFAQFLVECGIDSISLSPDAVLRMRVAIAEFERDSG